MAVDQVEEPAGTGPVVVGPSGGHVGHQAGGPPAAGHVGIGGLERPDDRSEAVATEQDPDQQEA